MLTISSRGSWLNQNFRHVLQILSTTRNSRFESNYERFQRSSLIISGSKFGSGYWMHPGVNFFSTNRSTSSDSNGAKSVNVQPPVTSSASFRFSGWLRWVFGSVLSFLLALSNNWQKLRRIEGEAEMVVEGVEKVANVVEKVATVAEEVAEDVSENLSDESNLKNAALVVENISKQAAHDAHLTQDFLHKVDEVKNDLDDLESFVEPIIDKISNKQSSSK
ncbi:uncharacterized protein LOC114728874 isoform X1 [Neltuma alba]|uniref:uncharacterized protein LOC114728874 isoform X1 n=1 Tax=Neltuma alba TaxID=207710 RepID=UPI0010A41591|nr:uncharacterized protein LOC114728874 isoform X1 [Prosopis alba]